MAIFLTGSTGYIGAHVAANLLETSGEPLALLVRARDADEARKRAWQALQLHMDFARFRSLLDARMRLYCGDITEPRFGLDDAAYAELARSTDSVIHCAATLNRRSERSCMNVNLRGTLEVLVFARRAAAGRGLRRFSLVSTVAVAGERSHAVVAEDAAIDWNRRDYDPYARTKKFAEAMTRALLPDVPITIFRPSIVLGDSRRPETNQFDMVRAFVFLAGLPLLPLRPTDRVDIVPVDFVADAIAALHLKPKTAHDTYHLSSGTGSLPYRELTDALARARRRMRPVFLPSLERPFFAAVNFLANRRFALSRGAALMKVFLPYLVWDTVFDNTRVTAELGRKPAPFSEYCVPLLEFSRRNHFRYPYREWPSEAGATLSAGAAPR